MEIYTFVAGFPCGTVVKNLPANAGDARDVGSISGLGRSPGGGNDNPLQYSCLGNPMDRGAWSELPFPSPGDLPDLAITLASPALHADSLPLSHQGNPSHKKLL